MVFSGVDLYKNIMLFTFARVNLPGLAFRQLSRNYYSSSMKKPLKHHSILLIISFLLIFSSCSPLREISEKSQRADQEYAAGNYEEAYASYRNIIDKASSHDQLRDGHVYNRAGILAYSFGDTGKALEYLELARHTPAADADTYFTLAQAYREIDNLSREISNLERYIDNFPGGEQINSVRIRLFETYVESLNWQPALDIWPELPDDQYKNENLLENYLKVQKALNNEEKATDIAEKLLDLNANNTIALDHLARKHFHEATSRHNREMRAYEQNRTHRQYAILLEALEIINTDFRIALNYFERLYKQDPKPEYAGFLSNIYERFQDEEKARYYRRRSE